MENLPGQELLNKATAETFNVEVGELIFAPNYLQAAAIVGLLFLLVLTLARLRRMYVDWSLKGSMTMVFLGFMLALVLEGFLILGGRTALTEFLGWKSAPKPIQKALDTGREKLVDVLGVTEEVPASLAKEEATYESVVDAIQSLPPETNAKVKKLICTP